MRAKDILNEDWQKTNKQDNTDGMSQKAVNAYRRENPGSKLKTAVTKKPSELKAGSKDAKRRKSFCARMSGNPGPMKDEKGRPTPKAKALRRWNCEEDIQQLDQSIEEAKKTLKNSNPCWKGYKPVGTKKKGGRTVPNCVPVNEAELGTQPKRPARAGSRPERGHEPQQRYGISKDKETQFHAKLDKLVHNTFGKRDDEMEESKTVKKDSPKPRNFVAKNAMATTSGAGAHKDKKKAEKQGDVKHKGKLMDLAEMEDILEKASRQLCKSSTPDEDLGASNLASCKSQGLRARDGNKSHKLGKTAKSRIKVGGHRIKGNKYGGPLPDWS